MPVDRRTKAIKLWLRGQVSPWRYTHIEGVVKSAKSLARKHRLPVEDVELAAWLHDSAKELPKSRMLRLIRGTPFKLDAQEKKMPGLWHPHAGAALALKKWGIRKPQILEAIRCHTLGSPGMGPLAQAVFVADFIEQGRQFEGVGEARREAAKGLREGVLAKCSMTLGFLGEKRMVIHPRLVDTWNAFLGH